MRINERVVPLNDKTVNEKARYVLYWMQMFKRVENNHALSHAIRKANELKLPLVVYEGLKYYYPWASDRLHTFILEGVEEKRAAFEKLGIRYVFYLQENSQARGLRPQLRTGIVSLSTRSSTAQLRLKRSKTVC